MKEQYWFLVISLFYVAVIQYAVRSQAIPYGEYYLAMLVPIFLLVTMIKNRAVYPTFDCFLFFLLAFALSLNWVADERNLAAGLGAVSLLCVAYLISRNSISLPKLYVTIAYLIMLISIVYDLSVYRYRGRHVLNSLSPNMSGLYILLFFYFCAKQRLVVGQAVAIVSLFLIVSRNFFVAVALFYLLQLIKRPMFAFLESLRIRRFEVLSFAATAIVILGSYTYTHSGLDTSQATTGVNKLITYVDRSNHARFVANTFIFEHWLTNIHQFLLGVGKDALPLFHKANVHGSHNSFLRLITAYGALFCLPYFLIIARIINRHFTLNNAPYILSFLFFLCFVHAGFAGLNLIFFAITLAIKPPAEENVDFQAVEKI